jgi:hypothetical protein
LKVVRGRGDDIDVNKVLEVLTKQETLDKFTCLQEIHTFLNTLQLPKDLSWSQLTSFLQQTSGYFITEEKLCQKQGSGQHQLIVDIKDQFEILCKTHNNLGHKGIYATQRTIID